MTMAFGYLPELLDVRDFTIKDVRDALPDSLEPTNTVLPDKVDNRQYCSPIENQLDLGSCTANSGVSMFEYMERKAFGCHIDGSRLFVYWNSRRHAGLPTDQDTGSYIRSTIKAITLNGIPEEKAWPYIIKNYKNRPTEDIYSDAQNFKATKYIRLDNELDGLITRMQNMIFQGFPINFGFTVYECINDVSNRLPVLPFPSKREKVLGGHAIYLIGYDNNAPSRNNRDGHTTKGAFLAANSWGTNFGDRGFFYVPYEYFTSQLATDVWSITSIAWVDTGVFN